MPILFNEFYELERISNIKLTVLISCEVIFSAVNGTSDGRFKLSVRNYMLSQTEPRRMHTGVRKINGHIYKDSSRYFSNYCRELTI